ncbi:MAG: Fe-S cluster assembly ATPase SufC [bacterium]|nr:Fe-S cluster assembly ATPase SufC [bacterium]
MMIIKSLKVKVKEKEIVKGVSLTLKKGEVHVLMGPNGAGKTTLAMSLMGDRKFKVQSSKFKVNRRDMVQLKPEERAREGLFVTFQNPVEIEGISLLSLLRNSYKSIYPKEKISITDFKERVKDCLKDVGLGENFMQRDINVGFSGGEKKRAEIAQLLTLKPKFAILDEVDSGVDVDSLRLIATAIKKVVKNGTGIILITHSSNILKYIKPDFVHVLKNGMIKKSGGIELAQKIEREGYESI